MNISIPATGAVIGCPVILVIRFPVVMVTFAAGMTVAVSIVKKAPSPQWYYHCWPLAPLLTISVPPMVPLYDTAKPGVAAVIPLPTSKVSAGPAIPTLSPFYGLRELSVEMAGPAEVTESGCGTRTAAMMAVSMINTTTIRWTLHRTPCQLWHRIDVTIPSIPAWNHIDISTLIHHNPAAVDSSSVQMAEKVANATNAASVVLRCRYSFRRFNGSLILIEAGPEAPKACRHPEKYIWTNAPAVLVQTSGRNHVTRVVSEQFCSLSPPFCDRTWF